MMTFLCIYISACLASACDDLTDIFQSKLIPLLSWLLFPELLLLLFPVPVGEVIADTSSPCPAAKDSLITAATVLALTIRSLCR